MQVFSHAESIFCRYEDPKHILTVTIQQLQYISQEPVQTRKYSEFKLLKISLVTPMIISDTSTDKSLPSNSHHHHDDKSAHPHHHDEESMRRLVNRLSRIEGHVRGIKTMVQENRPCPEVLVQVAAVRGALDRVARIILDEHLSECIARAAKEGNIDTEIEELKAALDRFLP